MLAREKWLGYRVIGALTSEPFAGEFTPGGLTVIGQSQGVRLAIAEFQPDVVFFADSSLMNSDELREVVWDLENGHTQVVVAPSVADISGERVRVRPVGGLPLIHIEKPQTLNASRRAKRLFDLIGAALLLVMFAPLLALCGIRIWVHDRGPVIYRQARVGKSGELFNCYKFRSMVVNAETLQAELENVHGAELLFKLKEDPRVTRPGRWLRRYSLDELPQLLNVLFGHMSLVGPRPHVAEEMARYGTTMSRRLLVRPGMTGLWQVSGRSDLSPDEAKRLDLYYVDNWSMLQDLAILWRTLGAVFGSRGAY